MTARWPHLRLTGLALAATGLVLVGAFLFAGERPGLSPGMAEDQPPACSSCDARHQRLPGSVAAKEPEGLP